MRTKAQKETRRVWCAKNRDKLNAQMRAQYRETPEVFKARALERYHKVGWIQTLARKYGLTHERFVSLLDACEYKCAICLRPFNKSRRPVVDHCHQTGMVRGILCDKCNVAEGLLGSPDTILRLYQYALKNELFYQGKN